MDLYDFVGGYGHLVMIGRSGFMTHAETEKSIQLFAREVLPRLVDYHRKRQKEMGVPAPALA
jgi:hypothetical protein